MKKIFLPLLLLVFVLSLVGLVNKATAQEKLNIATKTVEPFVMKDSYTGFSMDIWDEISSDLDIDYFYTRVDTVSELLNEVETGNADLAIAAITINSDRLNRFDFSHPFYDSGLQILVGEDNGKAKLNFEMFIPILEVLFVLFLAMILASHFIWFSERGQKNSDFSDDYLQGIWDAFWWSAVTVTTVGYGDKTPKKVSGRIIGIIWMFSGLFLIAYFTSSVTSSFTVQKLQNEINSVNDLKGKIVATIEGTTAMKYLDENNLKYQVYSNFDEAIEGVKNGEVKAFIYDAPVLQYYVNKNDTEGLKVIGNVFNPETYGIAFNKDSVLRQEVNRSILKMQENGTYERIYKKWFGEI